jgi:hypothetical protein
LGVYENKDNFGAKSLRTLRSIKAFRKRAFRKRAFIKRIRAMGKERAYFKESTYLKEKGLRRKRITSPYFRVI